LAQNPDRIQNANWAATGFLIHGPRTPRPRAIIAKSITVTVAPPFDGHDAGDRYRASGSNATITVPMVLDIRRLRALELMLRRPRRRAVYSGTSLDVASDHGVLIEANRHSVPKSAGAPERVGLGAAGARDTGRSSPLKPRLRAFALLFSVRRFLTHRKTKPFRVFESARRGDRAQRLRPGCRRKSLRDEPRE
jgi:hypothetical protein